MMILIQLLLIYNCMNAQTIFNSSLIESNQDWRDEENQRRKENYVHRIQEQLYSNDLIQNLKKSESIKTPNKLILESIEDILKTNILLKIKEYKRTEKPQDIQAIAIYDYLKELSKKLDFFFQIIQQSQEFFQGFEVSIKNLIDILQKIDESLNKIKSDRTKSNSEDEDHDYDRSHEFGYRRQQNIMHHQRDKKRVSKKNQLIQLSTSGKWEFKEKPPIEEKECPNQLKKLNEEYIFFLKIQETLIYISEADQIDPILQKLIPFENKYQINSKLVQDFTKSFNLNILDEDTLENMRDLGKLFNFDDYEFQDQIQALEESMTHSIKLLNSLKPLLDFGDQLIRQIINLFDKINTIKQIYAYQPDQVYKQLQQLDRDYKICKGSESYEIIKDIKIPKNNNLQQVTDQNYIIPPIKSDQCQKKIHDIEESLFEFIKNKILGKIENEYSKFLDYSFHQTFMFGPNPGIWKDRIRRYTDMNLDYFDNRFQRKLVKLAEYPSNYKPDDPQSVTSYQSLQVLNNKLWQISNSFDQAKSFMFYQKQENNIKNKFDELKQALKFPSQPELDTTISYYVLEQEIIDQFRDYKICKGKDFYESHKIVHIEERFIKQQNDKSNLIMIEEKKNTNNQVLQNETKKRIIKSLKAIKTFSNKKSKQVSYIQVQADWKYYDYPPILKNECQDELNIIKEDILQFKKIQVLFQYKKNYQENYNKIIENLLSLEDLFIENIRFIKLKMEYYDLESNIISVDNIPRSTLQQNNPAELAFDQLKQFNKFLVNMNDAYQKSKSLLNLSRDDFSVVRYNQYILNEYLNKEFKYQPDDVERELKQLYRDYQICTGRQYESEKVDAQKVIKKLFYIKGKKSMVKMNKKNKKYQK